MASYSSLSVLCRCPRARIFRTAMKGVNVSSDALTFGKAYHECIETGDINSGILELQKGGLEKDTDLLIEMYTRFLTFIKNQNIEILENEVEFTVNTEEGDFVGKIDAILSWNGEIYLGEFKTAKYITYDHVPIDSQITSYLWACDKIDKYHPKGLIWIANKKSVEKQPNILKNGHLSVAKNQGVSYSVYKKCADEIYGNDKPKGVEEFIEWLKQNDNPMILMAVTNRTKKQKSDYEKTLKTLMKQENIIMNDYKENGIITALRNCSCLPDKTCMQSCLYRDLCAELYTNENVTNEDVDVYIEGLKEE